MPIRDTHDESHQLIAQGVESIGRALIDLRYAERTTRVGQELLVIAGQLAQIAGPQAGTREVGLNASSKAVSVLRVHGMDGVTRILRVTEVGDDHLDARPSLRERFFDTRIGDLPAVRQFFSEDGLVANLAVTLAPFGAGELEQFDLALALLEIVILADRQAKARSQMPGRPSPGECGTSSQS
ncbi:hypothetical protein [Cupriavidus sp. UME77]|uniref:hypothetical protein n=1 Tax=Cupriavidus sp. UME77 TaxID=1862321 RepID=UPI001600458B|nr:hypothetical protein [Cupriavidus sp. UME77]MBB1630284.1 hypothetical protein [Cupriavidus sp. UME77]